MPYRITTIGDTQGVWNPKSKEALSREAWIGGFLAGVAPCPLFLKERIMVVFILVWISGTSCSSSTVGVDAAVLTTEEACVSLGEKSKVGKSKYLCIKARVRSK